MADFILKKKKAFTFSLEGSKKVYELPPFNKLQIDDIVVFQNIKDAEPTETYKAAKDFIITHCPGIEECDLGDYEYVQIFGAYAKAQNDMGES